MPKIAIAVGSAIVVVIGSVILFFDEPKGPDSGDEMNIEIAKSTEKVDVNEAEGSDSEDDIDTDEPTSPDSGDEIDTSEPTSPDSGDEIDTSEPTSPDSGDEIDSNEPTSPDSGDEIDPSEPTSPDSGDEIDPNEPTSPDSGDEISLSEFLKGKAKYSCNFIAEGSTCIEYIGSFWSLDNARMNCSGSFAKTNCPRPYLGGCRIGADSSNEIVTWHYGYGGDPYTEALPYAKLSCTALPGGQWVE